MIQLTLVWTKCIKFNLVWFSLVLFQLVYLSLESLRLILGAFGTLLGPLEALSELNVFRSVCSKPNEFSLV